MLTTIIITTIKIISIILVTIIIMGWSGLNSQGVAPLPCRAVQTQPEPLLLASTGWH